MATVFSDIDKYSDACMVFSHQSTGIDSWKEKRAKPIGNTFINWANDVSDRCNGSSKRSKSWSHPCSWHMAGDAHDNIERPTRFKSVNFDEEDDKHDGGGCNSLPAGCAIWRADELGVDEAEPMLSDDSWGGHGDFVPQITPDCLDDFFAAGISDPIGEMRVLRLSDVITQTAKQDPVEQKDGKQHHGLERSSERGMLEPRVDTSCHRLQLDNLLRLGGASADRHTSVDLAAHDHLCRDTRTISKVQNYLPRPQASEFIASQSQHFQCENPSSPPSSCHDLKQAGNLCSVVQLQNLITQAVPVGGVAAPSSMQKGNPSFVNLQHACGQDQRRAAAVLPSLHEVPLMHGNSDKFLQHQHVRCSFGRLPCAAALPADVFPVTTTEGLGDTQKDLRVATCFKQMSPQQQVNERTTSAVRRGCELTGTMPSMSQKEEIAIDCCHAQHVLPMQKKPGYERCFTWADSYESACDKGTEELRMPGAVMGPWQHREVEDNPDIPEGCTLMVRNIPERISTTQLVLAIEDLGLGKNLQCVYMPSTFSVGRPRSNGYAFVNFDTIAAGEALEHAWHQSLLLAASSESGWKQKSSNKRLNIGRAKVQGLRENLKVWSKSKTSRIRNSNFKPLLFNKAKDLLDKSF